MSIGGAYTPQRNNGDGSTRLFSFNWPFFAYSNIAVFLWDTINQVVNSCNLNGSGTYDFTATGTQNTSTREYSNGSITFNNAPPATFQVVIARATSQTQQNVFPLNGNLPGPTIEATADSGVMISQELDDDAVRALTAPVYVPAPNSMAIPPAWFQGGLLLAYDPINKVVTTQDPMVTATQASAAAAAASAAAAEAAAGEVGAGASLWARPALMNLATPPLLPNVGDRYLVSHYSPTGAWAAYPDQVAEWNGTIWLFSGAPQNNQTLQIGPARYLFGLRADTGSYLWRAIQTRQFKLEATQTLVVEGDSIGAGSAASAPTTNGFAAVSASRNGAALTNNSVGGKTTYQALISAYATPASPASPYLGAWPNGNLNAYLFEGGHNDAIFASQSPVLTETTEGNALTWWAKINAQTAVAASALTLSGYSGNIAGVLCMASAQLGGNGKFSGTPGDTISGTINGDNIVVFAYASDGSAGNVVNPFSLYIDGAGTPALTYNGNGQYDAASPDGAVHIVPRAIILRGLGAGNHTFIIENVAGGGVSYIDAVGTLLPPTRGPNVCFMLPPRPIASAYATIGPGLATPQTFEAIDQARQAWIQGYADYPICVARPNDWLNPANYNVDGEHPNTAGHLEIAGSIGDVVAADGQLDGGLFTCSVNAWTISGDYQITCYVNRVGSRVEVEYILAPNSGTNFTTSAGVSNLSLPAGLPFFSVPKIAQVLNATDGTVIGQAVMKSDNNGGGIYMPSLNLTNKTITITGSYQS